MPTKPSLKTDNTVGVLPYNQELVTYSENTKIYFVGYEMYAAQKGRVGVIVSKQVPYQYPELGDFIEVPRTIAADIEGKSRWNGIPTMLMEENGGATQGALVRKHYLACAAEVGLDKPQFYTPPQYNTNETHEEYEHRVKVWETQRDRALEAFYKLLQNAKIEMVRVEDVKHSLSDDEILRLAMERGLIPPTNTNAVPVTLPEDKQEKSAADSLNSALDEDESASVPATGRGRGKVKEGE